MRNRTFISCFLIVIAISFFGCTKETQTSLGDPIPVIKLVKIEPTTITQFKDSLSIIFTYEDGDGDLGYQDADINSLEIKDSRLQYPDLYYVAPLAPVDAKIHIQGQLTFKLRNLFLLGSASVEKCILELRIHDRAGHWSNKIISPEITIKK